MPDGYRGAGSFTEAERDKIRHLLDKLDDDDIDEFKEIVVTQRHIRWLWAAIRTWVIGGTAIAAGLVAFRNDIKEILSWIFAPK